MIMLEKVLKEYWFTQKQAKIYLVCLELGNAPASSIARRLWENRVTVYSALRDMCKRWIAFELIKNEIRYYTVLSPGELVIAEKKKYEKINSILPELMALSMAGQPNRPKVFYYEWFDWIKEFYEDQLTSKTTKCWFFWGKDTPKILQKYWIEEFAKKRAEKKVMSKRIISEWVYSQNFVNTDEKLLRESIVIKDLNFMINWDIWDNITNVLLV